MDKYEVHINDKNRFKTEVNVQEPESNYEVVITGPRSIDILYTTVGPMGLPGPSGPRGPQGAIGLPGRAIPEWDDIINRPIEFPPKPHKHKLADVIGLEQFDENFFNNFIANLRIQVLDTDPANPEIGQIWMLRNRGGSNG